MGKRKIPDCPCVACRRFNADGPELFAALEKIRDLKRKDLREMRAHFVLGQGCDLCGRNVERIAFVPQIIKDFFQIEYLCDWCRETINRLQREQEWSICWGSTSDYEIKWFLVALVYEQFRMHFDRNQFVMWWDCCVKGCHARRAPVRPEPYQWPTYEEEEAPDIEITIKPRFRIRAKSEQ